MTIGAGFLSEPLLEFGNRQKLEHPQDGLFLYGPVKNEVLRGLIQVGVVGTPDGIALVKTWLATLQGSLPVERPDQLHTSPWPGFQAAFGVRLEQALSGGRMSGWLWSRRLCTVTDVPLSPVRRMRLSQHRCLKGRLPDFCRAALFFRK
jgi:hypothetical protein